MSVGSWQVEVQEWAGRIDAAEGDEGWGDLFGPVDAESVCDTLVVASTDVAADDDLGAIATVIEEVARCAETPARLPAVARTLLARSSELDIVVMLISAIGDCGTSEDAPDILAYASHESAYVRKFAAMTLGRLYVEGASSSADVLTRLAALSQDPADRVRDWATFALGSLVKSDNDYVRGLLARRLDDPDRDVRNEAVLGLAQRGDRSVAPVVADELAGPVPGILMVEAARHLADPTFVGALTRLLGDVADDDPDHDEIERALAACTPSTRYA